MNETRVEWHFNNKRLMKAIREKAGKQSLREIASGVGISASTVSRLDNNYPVDMDTFLKLCNHYELDPSDYFQQEVWERKS